MCRDMFAVSMPCKLALLIAVKQQCVICVVVKEGFGGKCDASESSVETAVSFTGRHDKIVDGKGERRRMSG